MSERSKALLMAGAAMTLVGSTVVASKLIAGGLPPFSATALRFALALPLFLLLMRWRPQPWPRLGRRDLGLLLLQSGAGSVGYTVLLIKGMALSAGSEAGVISGTLPAVSALLGLLLVRQWPTARQLLALLLASAGVLILQHGSAAEAGTGRGAGLQLGHLLLLGAVVCEALFILLNKALRQPLAPLQLSAVMAACGLLLSLPLALAEWWGGAAAVGDVPASAWLSVLYYALLPTVGGFLLWYGGAQRLQAAEAAMLTALMPVSAMLLSVLLLDEMLGARQLFGLGAVLTAMLVLLGARPATGPD
ncbi:DMT family transporter [Paucibacter sp. APW11]|uniref:DMT family transporter n=1 Tax=Roseateles aquae TaxID=3077235 RepID=A0ABU3PBG7_9BURK|nr:DMT family transporter [Paucibacter sp. APW11]MDT8999116.1 DMT family transporter [Paucibacter sp. APW11]